MSKSIGSSRPIKRSKNFNLKTKFNKISTLKRQLMSRQAIHTRPQRTKLPLHGQNTTALQHNKSVGRLYFRN